MLAFSKRRRRHPAPGSSARASDRGVATRRTTPAGPRCSRWEQDHRHGRGEQRRRQRRADQHDEDDGRRRRTRRMRCSMDAPRFIAALPWISSDIVGRKLSVSSRGWTLFPAIGGLACSVIAHILAAARPRRQAPPSGHINRGEALVVGRAPAVGSPLNSRGTGGPEASARTSGLFSGRARPDRRSPSQTGPIRTRTSRAIGASTAPNIRRSWRFQPWASVARYQTSAGSGGGSSVGASWRVSVRSPAQRLRQAGEALVEADAGVRAPGPGRRRAAAPARPRTRARRRIADGGPAPPSRRRS